MKFGISSFAVELGSDFIDKLDKWKKTIFMSGLKKNLRRLIEKDLKEKEGRK